MASGRYISYLRVSTGKQGKSGLGIEAQREAVAQYLNGGDWELLEEVVEVESGKKDDRPQLSKALHQCKVTGATLLIAKLDRLSRDAHFLLGLQRAGVRFVAADMPEANELMVGLMAILAQNEREMISKRTKEALAAAKRRGVKLGNPNGARALRGLGNAQAVARIKEKAQEHAENLRTVIEHIREEKGITSMGGIAAALNDGGYLTPRNKAWHATSVARLMQRLEQSSETR